MGITLIPYSSLTEKQRSAAMKVSTDGYYIEDKHGKDLIYYNDDKGIPYARTNMTILHEIGHCVLDHTGATAEEEAEVAFFAKYAAAPPPLVHRIKPKRPEEIAELFYLSHEASCIAMDYYRKWLVYGGRDYTEYETRLLRLFDIA